MTYSDWCSEAVATATGDDNYIGAVCRLNGDDTLMVRVRNDEYRKPPSLPVTSSDRLKPEADQIVRIQPVRQLLVQEWEPAFEIAEQNEVRYWKGIHRSIETRQSRYTEEAMVLYRSRYAAIGLVGDEWMAKAEQQIRESRLADAKKKVDEADEALKRADLKLSTARRSLTEQVDKEYRKLHGNPVRYPSEYVRTAVAAQEGGHAEENLIRIWRSITHGLHLETVELLITRMPCPDKSSGFSLGGTVYKEGCLNKLIQLAGNAGDGVTWTIRYHQRLSGEQEALARAFSTGFPRNVTFSGPG